MLAIINDTLGANYRDIYWYGMLKMISIIWCVMCYADSLVMQNLQFSVGMIHYDIITDGY